MMHEVEIFIQVLKRKACHCTPLCPAGSKSGGGILSPSHFPVAPPMGTVATVYSIALLHKLTRALLHAYYVTQILLHLHVSAYIWMIWSDTRNHLRQRNRAIVTCALSMRLGYIVSRRMFLCQSLTQGVCLYVCLFVCPPTNWTRSLAIAKRPCYCCIILKSGSYTKAIYVLIGLFQSNRHHRLTFRRVIIEKWMYMAQVPMNNAIVLGNLCEYRHKWYIAKKQILWTTFPSQTVPIFNRLDVIGPQSYRIRR